MKPWTLASSVVLGASLALGAATGLAQQAQEDPAAAEEQIQPGETMTQEGMAAGTEQDMQTGAAMAGDAPMGLDAETVRELQQALNEAGHDIDVDGIWGPETQSALREFQQEQGMEATGEPDEQTLAMLGVDATMMQPGAGPEQQMQEQGEGTDLGTEQQPLDQQQDQPQQQ